MNSVPLSDAVTYIRGITFKPDDKVEPGTVGSAICMRTKNIQTELDESDLIAVPKSFVRRDDLYLKVGDVLISSANSWELVGKCCQVKQLNYDATAGGFISIVRGNSHVVDPNYLYHWLSSDPVQHKIRHLGRQTTNISNLPVDQFLDLEIPLPKTRPEQIRIATILQTANDIRRKRQQAIAFADEFLRSLFLDRFGDPKANPKQWDVCTLEASCDTERIITYGIVQAGPEYPGGIPYIKTGDFVGGELRIGKYSLTSPEIAANYKRSEVKTGDLVYCIRASVGAVDLLPEWLDGANLTQGTARIALKKDQDRHFWLYQLKTKGFFDWVNRRMKGATFKEITLGALREAPVITPPFKLQKEFGDIARKVLEIKSKLTTSNDKYAEILFKSCQQRAFRGEL